MTDEGMNEPQRGEGTGGGEHESQANRETSRWKVKLGLRGKDSQSLFFFCVEAWNTKAFLNWTTFPDGFFFLTDTCLKSARPSFTLKPLRDNAAF